MPRHGPAGGARADFRKKRRGRASGDCPTPFHPERQKGARLYAIWETRALEKKGLMFGLHVYRR